jgi:hypothetical protein
VFLLFNIVLVYLDSGYIKIVYAKYVDDPLVNYFFFLRRSVSELLRNRFNPKFNK